VCAGATATLCETLFSAYPANSTGHHERNHIVKLGIVGLPGCGKSTVFRALTGLSEVEGRKPSHEPSVGVVKVADERMDFLVKSFHPKKITPIEIEFLDFGSAAGEGPPGRGVSDRLLGAMRTLDAFVHCIRFFDSAALGTAAPLRDFAQLNDDFCLADLGVVEKRIERVAKDVKKGRKDLEEELALLGKARTVLEAGKPLRTLPEAADSPILRGFSFLTAKPYLVLVNAGDDKSTQESEGILNELLQTIAGAGDSALGDWLYGDAEAEITRLEEADAREFLAELGLTKPAAARVVSKAFQLLSLITFFTCGEKEVRAWPLKKGLRAPEAAGTVHSDMQRGFIRAEVTAYDHFRELGSMGAAKKAGKVRLEGKDYTIRDGDMVLFLFGV
jgi:GTP-binding protein YchF